MDTLTSINRLELGLERLGTVVSKGDLEVRPELRWELYLKQQTRAGTRTWTGTVPSKAELKLAILFSSNTFKTPIHCLPAYRMSATNMWKFLDLLPCMLWAIKIWQIGKL